MQRSRATAVAMWMVCLLASTVFAAPASAAALFEAECWIDDDTDFDWGQTNAGRVYGTSTFQLRADCQLAAQSQFGAQSSSDIRDVAAVPGVARQVQARCWLDDDTDFDWGQYDAGNLVGTSTYELRQECRFLAQSRYGANGSSGIKDIVLLDATEEPSMLQAQCWIDDDVDFDWGQYDAGNLFGNSTYELRQECRMVAQSRYGANGTSGLKDVVLLP